MQRQLFPKDEMLHDIIKSDEFQKLLGTDATTEEGQDYIAEYYEVAKDWKALKKQGKNKGTIADAASAYCDGHIASMKHEDAAASFTALLGLPLP
jgi:hypothetical protein